jgi:hypothetical protein
MVLENDTETPEIPGIPDEPPTTPIEQVVTPIIETSWTDQQFNYNEPSIQKVYVKINDEYKQAAVYLFGSPAVVHLNK